MPEGRLFLLFSLLFHAFFVESGRGQACQKAHSRPEDDAFGGPHETGQHREHAEGIADKESPENKTAHTEPHGRFFSHRIKKEVSVIIYGRPLFCQ